MSHLQKLMELMDRVVAPPKLIKPYVQSFAREVVADGDAVFVPCRPVNDAPYNECFLLIEEQVARMGGVPVFGWAIREFPKIMLEAEFHAVWRSPDGELVDISPRPSSPDRILFVADAERIYRGRQVDNIRKPLTKDKDVHRFITLARERFRLLNQGEAKFQSGEVELPPPVAKAMRRNLNESGALTLKIFRRYAAASVSTE
ncbi:MAG: zinc chelation protein SecC [Betaproteobacteria bacterium]|nr:zinc chelation protein SecC [Betaproteobacteria bacterium]